MASTRPRRSNAGAKMASLLNEEEQAIVKDDFYSTTYGGFTEEQDDRDFTYQSPNEDADDVDSDFSIDENDEPRSDVEDADADEKKRAKRGAGVVTKAYKEPPAKKLKEKRDPETEVKEPKPKKKAPPPPTKSTPISSSLLLLEYGRKPARASTISKTAETAKRQKEREARTRRMLKKKLRAKKDQVEDLELTQEELLEEAKVTEKLNVASLKKYEQMELEARKKAVKLTSKSVVGPYIRYLSTTMPLIQEIESKPPAAEETISVDDETDAKLEQEKQQQGEDKTAETTTATATAAATTSEEGEEGLQPPAKEPPPPQQQQQQPPPAKPAGKQERTFLTFSDFNTLRETFPHRKSRQPQQKICPITRLPAKYVDPVTRLPYANLQAFKFLREYYYNQLEIKGDKEDPEVAAWLEWRQKNKPAKQTLLSQVSRTPTAFSQLGRSTSNPSGGIGIIQQVTLPSHPVASAAAVAQQQQQQQSPLQGLPALAAAIRQGVAVHQQQSVVLPVRTTPLGPTMVHNSPSATAYPVMVQGQSGITAALPTQPAPNIQAMKIGGGVGGGAHINLSGQLPRSMMTTTMTAQQIQQLASRQGVLSSALQSALRHSGGGGVGGSPSPRAQLVARPTQMTTGAGGQTMLRQQTLVGQRPGVMGQSPTIALQRPGGTPIAVAVSQPRMGQAISLQQQQRAIGLPGQQQRQQIMVATASQAAARQIVMAAAAAGGGGGGGGVVPRSGQILQLTTGQGGQQHQIVVSQSGQLILNNPSANNTKAAAATSSNSSSSNN